MKFDFFLNLKKNLHENAAQIGAFFISTLNNEIIHHILLVLVSFKSSKDADLLDQGSLENALIIEPIGTFFISTLNNQKSCI